LAPTLDRPALLCLMTLKEAEHARAVGVLFEGRARRI
jgi:hypothetical protein